MTCPVLICVKVASLGDLETQVAMNSISKPPVLTPRT